MNARSAIGIRTENLAKKYSQEPTPIGSYAALVAAYPVVLFALDRLSRKYRSADAPKKIELSDYVLLLPAVHKLSRIVTKDWVTSAVRAPFVHFEKNAGAGEVVETARGSGPQKAIGDLLTCQFCIGPWISALMVYSLATRPRPTRLFAGIFALVAGSDFLHLSYEKLKSKKH